MAIFEVEAGGKMYEVEAPDINTAMAALQGGGGRFSDSLGENFRTAREGASEPSALPASGVTATEAGARGLAQGATLNFYDELRGLIEAGGAGPKDPASLGSLITGAAKYAFGNKEAVGRYGAAAEREREITKRAETEQPGASIVGNIGGALATLPLTRGLAPIMPGMNLGARMLQGAKQGGVLGAIGGLGAGEGVGNSAAQAASGGVFGGLLGGAGVPAVEGLAKGASILASPFINMARGAINPTASAERAIGRAYGEAVQADPTALNRLKPADLTPTGPQTVMDVLGQPGRNLARSAGNISGGARDTLNQTLDARFETQGNRVTGWLNSTFNYPNAHAQEKAIDHVAKTVNNPAYKIAYREGDKPIWSPELQRLVGSPDVVDAMRSAAERGKSRAIAEGMGGFNSSVKISPTGVVEFTKGKNGVPTYPNLQFWDYTKRALDDQSKALARAGRDGEAKVIGDLAKQLRGELDQHVGSYAQARAGAAHFFGAENALEAGQNFVRQNFAADAVRDQLSKMKPMERQLFQDGFVSRLVETLEQVPDRADIVRKIYNSPAAKEKINLVLGTQRATELEAMLRIENIMQQSLKAVQGNSTTTMQLLGAGLAGAGGGGYLGFDPTTSGVASALAMAGKRGIDMKVANKVAEMLTSKDPTVLRRAVSMAANNQKIMEAIRSADTAAARIGGSQSPAIPLPSMQAPGIGRAEDE